MSSFLTIIAGILLGVAGTGIAMLWRASENDYCSSVFPGQRWKVKGIGIITVKETLSGGKYYHKFGAGTNVAYITESGHIGHCAKHAITKHGTLIRKMSDITFINDEIKQAGKDGLITYDRRGRIVGTSAKETINAEFCDVEEMSNVYHLVPRNKR